MAITDLLSTQSVNLQDLLGNGKAYSVPPYQRDYSWDEGQWEDLWLDILELNSSGSNRHYMGAVVVTRTSDRTFKIIDGQQRLATLTLFSLAVIATLNGLSHKDEKNLERAETLRSMFIGAKDPASLLETSKLELNVNDDGFFQDYLIQIREPANPRGLTKSNQQLYHCYHYFLDKLGSVEQFNDGEALASLLSNTVARQLVFILITVQDEVDAYTVFETLNARGLELTVTDLLKNYLFSRFHGNSDISHVQRLWGRILATVRQENFDEFLRFYYLTKHSKIRKGRLFKLVKDDIRNAGDVLELLQELETKSEVYAAIFDPNHEYWVGNQRAKAAVREFRLFRVKQIAPLLMSAYGVFSSEEFTRLLELLSVISFRYTVIGSLNPSELENAYHLASRKILEHGATRSSEIFQTLLPIYVSDSKFQSDFSIASFPATGQKKKLIRYILCKLEEDCSHRHLDFETDPATIEHILPENPSEAWGSTFDREQWDGSTNRIGNLTLLSPSDNRLAANLPYEAKLEIFEHSDYGLTKSISELAPEEWTYPHLEKRQEDMAARAVHIWRSAYV